MSLETVVVAIGPTEESRIEQLAETLLDVVEPCRATVVLYHAFSERALKRGAEEIGIDAEGTPDPEVVVGRLESVDAITDELDALGVDNEVRSAVESPQEGIVRVAEQADADMVFIGGRKRSSTGKAVFGSTAHSVLMNAPCPVTFVREDLDDG
ncbi:MAG: universal stress protein [Halopenitus sp.]